MANFAALVSSTLQALQPLLVAADKRDNLVEASVSFLQLRRGKANLLRGFGHVGAQIPQLFGEPVYLLARPGELGIRFGQLLVGLGQLLVGFGQLLVVLELLIVKPSESVPKIFGVKGGHRKPPQQL